MTELKSDTEMAIKYNAKALRLLREDEQAALNLQIMSGKSTWDAGQIMGKSHYKYLEIASRAKQFVKVFTHYYNTYQNLVPDAVKITPGVRDYFIRVIEKRMAVAQSAKSSGEPLLYDRISREQILNQFLDYLQQATSKEEQAFYNMILEFDRWNNFRIIPDKHQLRSAFKRREKTEMRQDLERHRLNDHAWWFLIKDKLKKGPADNRLYCAFMMDPDKANIKIINCAQNEDNLALLTKFRVFAFRRESDAIQHGNLISRYLWNPAKHCKDGQLFWPLYRESIGKATNYRKVMGLGEEGIPAYASPDMDPNILRNYRNRKDAERDFSF